MLKTKLTQRGDTLVEVLIAIAILSFVLASSYAVTSRAIRLGQSARERAQGVAFVSQQAEIIQSYASRDWDSFIDDVDDPALATGHFKLDTWEPATGELTIPASFQSAAADYKVSYTRDIDNTPAPVEVRQVIFTIKSTWVPSQSIGVDAVGDPIRESTTVVIKVSPSRISE